MQRVTHRRLSFLSCFSSARTPASRFAIAHQHSTPRSPSQSLHRQEYSMSHELDPLLANLSPTSTLEALEATEAIDLEGRASQSLLHNSVDGIWIRYVRLIDYD